MQAIPQSARARCRQLSAALGCLFLGLSLSAAAQTAPAPSEALRPTLSSINEALASLNVSKWKAPGEVRSVTQRDIDSIQRDLSSTLPPLLDAANTQPISVASVFAVYRNIDALYDVLLRVSETATLAGSQNDAASLQKAQTSLESARRELGDAILQLADSRERELAALRAAAAQAAAAAAAAPPPPPVKTVVDDGPAASPKGTAAVKRKKKPAPAPTTPATPPQ